MKTNRSSRDRSWKAAVPYLTRPPWSLLAILVGAFIFATVKLIEPYVFKHVIDDVFVRAQAGELDTASVMHSAAIAGATIFVAIIFTKCVFYAYTYVSYRLSKEIEMRMYRDALAHLFSLDIGFHRLHNSVEVLAQVGIGIESFSRVIHEEIAKSLLPGIITAITLIGWVFYLDWRLALAATTLIPFHVAIALRKARPIFEVQMDINKSQEQIIHRAYEGVANIDAVISGNAAEHELTLYWEERAKAFAQQMRIARWWRLTGFSTTFFESASRVAVILVGAWLILGSEITIGDFAMFMMYVGLLYQPLFEMVTTHLRLQSERAKVARFFALMDIQPKVVELPHAVSMPPLRHAISFENVSFSYREGADALDGITVTIPAGKTVAIVGPTGAGKSTLVNLIQRYYDPTSGHIVIDGTDLRTIRLASLREAIAVVPQHAFLFSRSIRDNIRYGRFDADNLAVLAVAKAANAHEFIEKKQEGYDSTIGERGALLSGGEQQRVAIARAIIKDASIIIMDEATAHLDARSEAIVQKALGSLLSGKTSIIIAHRLATVRNADQIIVMDHGCIVDSGTNSELLERCTLYKQLYDLQFRDAEK